MAEMTLREVCLALGVSRRAIQGYENANLVSATNKTESGYLLYNDSARERIRQIKLYQNMEFTLLYIPEAYYCTLRAVNKKQTTLKYHFSVACLFTQLFIIFPQTSPPTPSLSRSAPRPVPGVFAPHRAHPLPVPPGQLLMPNNLYIHTRNS